MKNSSDHIKHAKKLRDFCNHLFSISHDGIWCSSLAWYDRITTIPFFLLKIAFH
jgi:hypothetical protein